MREAVEEMIWEPHGGRGMRQPEGARCGCSHMNRCLCSCVIPSASKGIKHLTLKCLKTEPKVYFKADFYKSEDGVYKRRD